MISGLGRAEYAKVIKPVFLKIPFVLPN